MKVDVLIFVCSGRFSVGCGASMAGVSFDNICCSSFWLMVGKSGGNTGTCAYWLECSG